MVSIGTVLTKCGWQLITAPKTYAGDIKAFAKAVPSGKTFIYALQMSIKHLALLKAFRQTVFQNRTSSSCKPLPATSRQKNQTVTLDTKLHLDLTKLGRPVCENQTVLSA